MGLSLMHWVLASVLFFSALGVILARNPVHACLAFLLTLLSLAAVYLELSAQFIAAMQILIYAGAILVIFMFVIVLFQDAYQQIKKYQAQSMTLFLWFTGAIFLLASILFNFRLIGLQASGKPMPKGFGTVESLGLALYVDFFFPFEAVILLFLVAIIGALYIGKKVR